MNAETIGGHELCITRKLAAPRSLVFRIWAERDHMQRWLGPKNFTCTELELDFRPGGKWRACIVSDEYGENWMGGEFREIVENERIVYSFAWDDEQGRPGKDTTVTVTFAERDGATLQTFHQVPFESVESRDSHIGGWNESFDREQAYAESLAG